MPRVPGTQTTASEKATNGCDPPLIAATIGCRQRRAAVPGVARARRAAV
jgi:hypothetical protein